MQNGSQPRVELNLQNIVAILNSIYTDYNRLYIQASQDELSLTIKQRIIQINNAFAAELAKEQQAEKDAIAALKKQTEDLKNEPVKEQT